MKRAIFNKKVSHDDYDVGTCMDILRQLLDHQLLELHIIALFPHNAVDLSNYQQNDSLIALRVDLNQNFHNHPIDIICFLRNHLSSHNLKQY